ncbi:universal stress protein [Acidiluteibacter ferrifornacis]|uniref:Universal stress protein n=1 Tax=Acidiluteibacter ferrifornacis TaxID=2692424 RepID=A0A6N9NM68_9FLAO|nr:universal stress protein [Acidiluteibacter ferrifornacis]NBG66320.1 universal stress protein [Acidiluteibacter ferrifornacis]
MKKILIPTDFSQNAKKATDYAITLFDSKETSITLLNTFSIPYTSAEVAYSVNDIIYDNAQLLFEEEVKRIQNKFPNLESKITTSFHVGSVIQVVNSIEMKENIDLIVMGTKGASGMSAVLIGSTTASIIKNITAPLLVVPEKADLESPKRILFTTDEELIGREIDYHILQEIAHKNKSVVDALYISNSANNKEVIETFIDYELDLNLIDIPHHLNTESGKNIEKAILNYTDNHPTDLVVMVSNKGNLFYNLFHKSITKQIAMHTKLPLLVLHNNLKK